MRGIAGLPFQRIRRAGLERKVGEEIGRWIRSRGGVGGRVWVVYGIC